MTDDSPEGVLRGLQDEARWDVKGSSDLQRPPAVPPRWSPAKRPLAVAAAVLLIVAGMLTAFLGTSHHSAPKLAAGHVAAWKALAAPPVLALAAKATLSAPDCPSSGLQGSVLGYGTIDGVFHETIKVADQSQTSCAVGEASATGAQSASGAKVRFAPAKSSTSRLLLAPGASVDYVLSTLSGCGNPDVVAPVSTLQVALGSAVLAITGSHIPPAAASCGVEVTALLPSTPLTSLDNLTAAIQLPATASAGNSLNYTVTITNPGPTIVTMPSPCPSYVEMVGPSPQVSSAYQLNCTPGQVLAPGQSDSFAMQLAMPAGATGLVKVAWVLDGYVVCGGTVTIT
jgi:hypothetical protein